MFQRQTTLDRRRRPDPVQAVRPCVLSTAWFPDIWPSSVNLSPTTMVIGQLVTGNCDLLPVGLRSSSHTGDIRRTRVLLCLTFSLEPWNALPDFKQEAQLPQRNSSSAVHVYLGWLTDRAMHRTPQNR